MWSTWEKRKKRRVYKRKNKNYDEDSIELLLDNNLKDFLYQFKPITKTKIFDTKKRKRKGKK